MNFEEWLEEYREDKNRSDADWYPNNVQVFEAGQQSKQAEIDALQKRINEALELINNQHDTSTIKFVRYAINKILKEN